MNNGNRQRLKKPSIIAQLYFDLIQSMDKSIIQQDIDDSQIQNSDDQQLVFYILQLFKTIDTLRAQLQQQIEDYLKNDYEKVIQSLEASIRNHIRTQYQLNLQIEILNSKIEEVIKDKDILITQLQDKIKELQTQISEKHNNAGNLYNNFMNHFSQLDIATQKKTPSAFEKMSKLMSNKSQQNILSSNLLQEERSLSQRRTSIPNKKTTDLKQTNNDNLSKMRQICFKKNRLQSSIRQDYSCSQTQREEQPSVDWRKTKKIILQLKGSLPNNIHLTRSGLQF